VGWVGVLISPSWLRKEALMGNPKRPAVYCDFSEVILGDTGGATVTVEFVTLGPGLHTFDYVDLEHVSQTTDETLLKREAIRKWHGKYPGFHMEFSPHPIELAAPGYNPNKPLDDEEDDDE